LGSFVTILALAHPEIGCRLGSFGFVCRDSAPAIAGVCRHFGSFGFVRKIFPLLQRRLNARPIQHATI
jgi:hypothetical protein